MATNINPQFAGLDRIDAPTNNLTPIGQVDWSSVGDMFTSFAGRNLPQNQSMFEVDTPATANAGAPLEMFIRPQITPSSINSNRGIPQDTGGGIFDLSAPTAPSAPAVGTAAVSTAQPASTAWGGVGGTQMPAQFQSRDQLVQWQQANGLTPDGLYGDKSAAKFAELNTPTIGTSMLDGYTQAGNAMSYAGVNNLSGAGMETPAESGSMFDSLKSAVGLESMTNADLLGMGGSILQGGLGAYGMFKNLDQMDTRLDQGQQQIDLSRDEYEENLRHRKSIVNQNKGA